MAKAVWNKVIVAESEDVKVIDGEYYFPKKSVKRKLLRQSPTKQTDSRKGTASYFNIVAGEEVNWNAAWNFSEPKEELNEIRDYIAFSSDIIQL